ncbi:hypothetical protein ABBQ38_006351 [Trebouxia sp. C0009 RCD-2024]
MIVAVYKLLDMKRKEQNSYDLFLEQYDKLDAVLRDRAKDNVPTARQRAGFVSYVELQKITSNEILLPYDRSIFGVLILREFKTQDRMNPKLYSRSLGNELSAELRASLLNHPRDYLFLENSTGRPYTHSGFAMYARRTLLRLFGRPCTLTLLRHSYISHMLAYGQLSIRDREQLARQMCHSTQTQAQY